MDTEAVSGATGPSGARTEPVAGRPAVGAETVKTGRVIVVLVAEPWDEIGPWTTSIDPEHDPW
jgi:hypothetical protein